MIGTRKAGVFAVSEMGRSGKERRRQSDRRSAQQTVAVDRRVTGERRIAADRRLVADVTWETEPPAPTAVVEASLDVIAEHRRALADQIGRDVGQEVAALDYFLNVQPAPRRLTLARGAALEDAPDEALTDPVTRLFNRGFLDSVLTRELARCRRHGVMTSLALVELDDFRATNGRWGRAATDAALRGVADVIRRQLRTPDVACRYSTSTIAVVLPDTYRSGALLVADRIVAEVRHAFTTRRVDACPIALSVSVGVAWYGAMRCTRGDLLESAASALAQAKAGGGDRVVEAS